MELDWTTFVLEIVNFLILVWLLKRFLYQPVLEFLARRRADIDRSMGEALQAHEEAEGLKAQYENRLTDWAQERHAAQEALHAELEQERARRLSEVKQAMAEEEEKSRVVEERRRQEFRRQAEQTALGLAGRFASRLLEEAAGPHTTNALAELLARELAALPDHQRSALRQAKASGGKRVRVQSAHPLNAEFRAVLESAVAAEAGDGLQWEYETDGSLIAGLRLTLGPWILAANLRDELKGFAELAHESATP